MSVSGDHIGCQFLKDPWRPGKETLGDLSRRMHSCSKKLQKELWRNFVKNAPTTNTPTKQTLPSSVGFLGKYLGLSVFANLPQKPFVCLSEECISLIFLLGSWRLSGKSNIKLNIFLILDESPGILHSVYFCSPTPLVFPIIQFFQYPWCAEGFFWKIQIITPCCSPHLFARRKTVFSAWSALLQ